MTQRIPDHLAAYIVQQQPELYTAMDHASWRFVLKVSQSYFGRCAHEKYLTGLRETGISTDRIPLISEMDACLRKFNWRAVAVSGFIPPSVFMEFFSLGILPIACDMRKIENLPYTPAPDIVHEAAGHAPIIADPEYAEYLRLYGEISRKAVYSDQDMAVYRAIRALSETKEDPLVKPEQVQAAQKNLDAAVAAVDHLSEATLLARMNWWTVEYGLVGDLKNPKIYGAGLLSSMGESYHCLEQHVRRIPLSVECVQMPYDITRPQPQLFVARDFHHLVEVLEEFAETMAFRRGGSGALVKARQARAVTTTQLDSGIQISGKLASFLEDANGAPIFLRYEGPVQLAHGGKQVADQGPELHAQGFSTPLGRLQNGLSPAELSESELKGLTLLEFSSGIRVKGKLKSHLRVNGKNHILSFENCTVSRGSEVLFQPEWGSYDLACGTCVESVCGGPADYEPYMRATDAERPLQLRQKSNLTTENRELNALYARVCKVRDSAPAAATEELSSVLQAVGALQASEEEVWLLRYECLELDRTLGLHAPWASATRSALEAIARQGGALGEIVARGLALLTA